MIFKYGFLLISTAFIYRNPDIIEVFLDLGIPIICDGCGTYDQIQCGTFLTLVSFSDIGLI